MAFSHLNNFAHHTSHFVMEVQKPAGSVLTLMDSSSLGARSVVSTGGCVARCLSASDWCVQSIHFYLQLNFHLHAVNRV